MLLISSKMVTYSSRCNNTCWNWHFFILNGTTRCLNLVIASCPLLSPTFCKPNNSIISPIASFFGRSLTWIGVYFAFSKHSFKYHVSTSPLMCGSKGKHLIISSSYHTCISYIINPLPYNIMYPSWFATSYSCPFFYGVNVVIPLMIYVPICFSALARVSIQQPMVHFRILLQLLSWRVKHMFKGRSLTFSLITLDNEWISLSS